MNSRKAIFIFLGMMFLASCRRSTFNPDNNPPPGPHYDPRNISRTETFSSSPALDIRGDHVVVVWNESDDGQNSNNFDIMFKECVNGEWSEAENISNTAGLSLGPKVALDVHGNVHVVWTEGFHAYYRMRDNEGRWSEIQDLGPGSIPSVGTDSQGRVYVIWQYMGLWFREKTGESWTERQGFAHGWADNPSLWVTPDGHLYVVAEGGDSYTRDIYFYERMPGRDWSEYFNVTNNNFYCWSSSVYGTDEGRVYVSWVEYGMNRIGFRVRDVDGRWGEVDTLPGIVGGPWNSFIWGCGDTLIVLWEEKTDNWEIYYRVRIGDEWGERTNITNTPGNSFMGLFPKIRDGKLYIVWSDSTDGNFDIFYDEVPLRF